MGEGDLSHGEMDKIVRKNTNTNKDTNTKKWTVGSRWKSCPTMILWTAGWRVNSEQRRRHQGRIRPCANVLNTVEAKCDKSLYSLHWIFVSICPFSLALVWLCEILLRCFISRWQGPATRYWVTVAYYRPCRVSWNHGSLLFSELLASQPILTYGYCELILWGRLSYCGWCSELWASIHGFEKYWYRSFSLPATFLRIIRALYAINSRVFVEKVSVIGKESSFD